MPNASLRLLRLRCRKRKKAAGQRTRGNISEMIHDVCPMSGRCLATFSRTLIGEFAIPAPIAYVRQCFALRTYQNPREKKLRLADVKEMFLQMKDHA